MTPFREDGSDRAGRVASTGGTLGVVGTLVWDRIFDRDRSHEPLEEWGGIAYAIAALRASLPDSWRILPMLKIGRDLHEEAFHFLADIPGVDTSAVVVVPEDNNRVELRYESENRRSERLKGGVPPWTWPELGPPVGLCDALYVNFISGFELTIQTARALRVGYRGPIYADLHSLFLGMTVRGLRVPQALAEWRDWLRCFDAVQMNEDEFELLGRSSGDPWQLAAGVLGPDLELITVTLGGRGAAYIAAPGFEPAPQRWSRPAPLTSATAARSGRVPLESPEEKGDPTGCGDVWGASFFARLLAGDGLEPAMRHANRLAARNVRHRGASGLLSHLSGRLAPARR